MNKGYKNKYICIIVKMKIAWRLTEGGPWSFTSNYCTAVGSNPAMYIVEKLASYLRSFGGSTQVPARACNNTRRDTCMRPSTTSTSWKSHHLTFTRSVLLKPDQKVTEYIKMRGLVLGKSYIS